MCTSEMCSSYAVVVTVARKFVSHKFSGLTRVKDEFPGKSRAIPSKHARSISVMASYGHHRTPGSYLRAVVSGVMQPKSGQIQLSASDSVPFFQR